MINVKAIRKQVFFLILISPFCLKGQDISKIEVFQDDKNVFIQYDLTGEGTFSVELYYSIDDGKTWTGPLKKVFGAVGEKQKSGKRKEMVWDVLAEQEEITGFCQFQITAKSENPFNTNSGTFVDERDGQVYRWVRIGEQIWMAENLQATKYSDGVEIRNITNNRIWNYATTGAYCLHNNDQYYKNKIGALYNWYAAKSGKLCPKGWHVPSDTEWEYLTDFLGGESISGGKMKITTEWHNSQSNENNSSGFSAIPSGFRYSDGNFWGIPYNCYWWSATESIMTTAWYRNLHYKNTGLNRHRQAKSYGYSVRCIKD